MMTVEMLLNVLDEDVCLERRDRNLARSLMTELIKPDWIVKRMWTDEEGFVCVLVDVEFNDFV